MSLLASSAKGQARAIVRRSIQQKRCLAAAAQRAADQDDDSTFGSLPSSSFSTGPTPAPAPRIVQPRFPQLEFPAPVLTVFPRQSSNSLKVVSSTPLLTVAHTLAIVRAVEKECSNTVIDVRQRKSRDDPRGSTIVHLTLLYPVEFPKNNPSREIRVSLPLLSSLANPDPKIRNGGPTLQEIESALNPPSSSSAFQSERQMTQFSVQVELNPPETYPIQFPKEDREVERRGLPRSRRDRRLDAVAQERVWAEEAAKPLRDEQTIVEVLGKWKGRYGGFKSLNMMYEGYKSPRTVEVEAEAREREARDRVEQEEREVARNEEAEREKLEHEERARMRLETAVKEDPIPAAKEPSPSSSRTPDRSPIASPPHPSPKHAPNPTPLRPSEKRLLATKFPTAPIPLASSPSSSSSPSQYKLSSQQGKVDALRKEAWDAKAKKEEELLRGSKGGLSGFINGMVPEFIQKGLSGEAGKVKR